MQEFYPNLGEREPHSVCLEISESLSESVAKNWTTLRLTWFGLAWSLPTMKGTRTVSTEFVFSENKAQAAERSSDKDQEINVRIEKRSQQRKHRIESNGSIREIVNRLIMLLAVRGLVMASDDISGTTRNLAFLWVVNSDPKRYWVNEGDAYTDRERERESLQRKNSIPLREWKIRQGRKRDKDPPKERELP